MKKERLRKLRAAPLGKSAHEMDKFKAVWRECTSEDFKQSWRNLLKSRTSLKEISAKLFAEHNVKLTHLTYVTRLHDWVRAQDKRDALMEKQNDRQLQVEKDLGPGATLDEVRAEVLKRSYECSLTEDDFKQGLATIRENVRVDRLALETRRVELLEKSATAQPSSAENSEYFKLTPEEREQRIKEIYGRA